MVEKALQYDRLGNLITLGDADSAANDQTYGYDKLNRLTDFKAPVLSTVHAYGYDANGNRETKTVNSVAQTNTYELTSNRIATINGVNYVHDDSGNITDNGAQTFTYDAKGRLAGTIKASVAYTYGINGLGQRVTKTSTALSSGGRVYVYDEAGHLLGEYNTTGARIQEHVWLDDQPVAVIGSGGTVFYVLSDQLNTPRQIIDSAMNLRWRWDYKDPFGNHAPAQNPQGLGGFGYNLRYPGQYADSESGLFYNYFQDYDPRLGRYGESDPIGLEAGLNTYVYVENNPINLLDPNGLAGKGNGGDGSATGKGTNTPYKHCREYSPPDPRFIECDDKHSGKKKRVPRPDSWPFPGPKKPAPQKSETCENSCQVTAATIITGTMCATVCALQPELCLPSLLLLEASQ